MSVQAMTWAFSLKLGSPSLKVTLLALANRVGDFNQCFPGIALLAEETDLSERTVKTCIAKLEELGLLERTRRHTPYGYRTSNSYTLMVGTLPNTEFDDEMAVDEHPPRLEADFAPRPSTETEAPTVRLGANFAPRPSTPKKPLIRGLEANSALRSSGPVDNSADEADLSANGARPSANAAPLKEEPKDLTQRSSSSTEVTTDALASVLASAAAPPDDDDERTFHRDEGAASGDADDGLGRRLPARGSTATAHDAAPPAPPKPAALASPSRVFAAADDAEAGGEPESEPLDVQQLFWAGVEMSLRDVDSRLDLSQIRRRLTDAGVDESRVDVPAAASFVLAAAARPVGDPSAYVAAAIIREPARWPWVPVAVSSGTTAPRQSMCDREGHRYVDEYRMQCVRCGEERQGWRDDRYAAEQAQAARDEAASRRAVAS